MVGAGHTTPNRRTAWLPILLLILLLSAIEPALHYWIACRPPEGAVPSGAHTGDSAHHILCMRAIDSGFHSPFARDAPGSIQNYCVPFFLLYALLGEVGRLLGVNEFIFLGWLNGFGGILLLTGAYVFLRAVSPRYANRAFCIFTLSGGLGGAAYWAATVSGWSQQPGFDQAFLKLAIYDLIEGQNLSPTLVMPRLYYSLPLGLCFFSFALLVRATYPTSDERPVPSGSIPPGRSTGKLPVIKDAVLFESRGRGARATLATAVIFLASFINPRLGPMALLVALLLFMSVHEVNPRRRIMLAASYVLGAVLGTALGFGVMSLHPVYLESVAQVTQSNMWLLSFLAATCWCWAAAPFGLCPALRSLPVGLRAFAWMLLGYLGAYVILYVAYHAYFGTWLSGGEVSASVTVSDWALAGAVSGLLAFCIPGRVRSTYKKMWHNRPRLCSLHTETVKSSIETRARAPVPHHVVAPPGSAISGWIVLWFLVFLATSISAVGHGWLLRFGPQRFMVFIGLPLALIVAWGLEYYRPIWRGTFLALILTFGAVSVLTGALCFQGPLGHVPGRGPFAYLHYEFIPEQDAALLKSLPPGTVVAPPWNPISFAEIIALRPNLRVVGGAGALNIGDQPFAPLQRDLAILFSGKATPDQIGDVLRQRSIDYVFLPSFCRLAPEQIEPLKAFTSGGESWAPGNATILTVRRKGTTR